MNASSIKICVLKPETNLKNGDMPIFSNEG